MKTYVSIYIPKLLPIFRLRGIFYYGDLIVAKTIIVVGSANTDIVIRLPRELHKGGCVLADSQSVFSGGKGLNRAVALSRLSENPIFYCCIGEDAFGDTLLETLKNENINTSGVFRTSDAGSGAAYVLLDKDGDNRIAVYIGANGFLKDEKLDKIVKSFDRASFLTLELEIPLESVERLNFEAQKSGVPVVIDAGPMRIETDKSIFKGAFILSPNEKEAEAITGIKIENENDIKEACKVLYDIGVTYSHIKLGEKGSVCYNGTDYIFCPAFNTGLPVVDTTAAGDCYMAALCKALTKSKDMEKAMRYASVAAGISVTKSGAAPSMPYLSEVEEAINKFNREGRF